MSLEVKTLLCKMVFCPAVIEVLLRPTRED